MHFLHWEFQAYFFNMKTKKSQGHLEFILSFALFAGFAGFILIIATPKNLGENRNNIDLLELSVIKNLSSDIEITRVYGNFSGGKCIEYNSSNVIARANNIRINASSNGEKVCIENTNEKFIDLIFSEDFESSSFSYQDCINCSISLNFHEKIISEKKIKMFNFTYYENYYELKNNLRVKNDFSYNLSFSGKEYSGSSKNVVGKVSAKTMPVMIISEDGEIVLGTMNIKTW